VRLLLDTHTLLWFDGGDTRLSKRARRMLENPEAELLVSAASVWELAIKSARGRLTLPRPLDEYVGELADAGYWLIPITAAHAARVVTLPDHHRDPFDRLLAAQALSDTLPLVTRDRIFRKYRVDVRW
jgi:PIN domain nuclease of toxin-antitoxin system